MSEKPDLEELDFTGEEEAGSPAGEEEVLGLSIEDVPGELDSKERIINALIGGFRDESLSEEVRNAKAQQLRMIQGDLGKLQNLVLRAGGHLPEKDKIEELTWMINRALAS